jgi:hypothetical protein
MLYSPEGTRLQAAEFWFSNTSPATTDADRPGVAPSGVASRTNSVEFGRQLPEVAIKNCKQKIAFNRCYILPSLRGTRQSRRVLVFRYMSRHH